MSWADTVVFLVLLKSKDNSTATTSSEGVGQGACSCLSVGAKKETTNVGCCSESVVLVLCSRLLSCCYRFEFWGDPARTQHLNMGHMFYQLSSKGTSLIGCIKICYHRRRQIAVQHYVLVMLAGGTMKPE